MLSLQFASVVSEMALLELEVGEPLSERDKSIDEGFDTVKLCWVGLWPRGRVLSGAGDG